MHPICFDFNEGKGGLIKMGYKMSGIVEEVTIGLDVVTKRKCMAKGYKWIPIISNLANETLNTTKDTG